MVVVVRTPKALLALGIRTLVRASGTTTQTGVMPKFGITMLMNLVTYLVKEVDRVFLLETEAKGRARHRLAKVVIRPTQNQKYFGRATYLSTHRSKVRIS